MLLSTQTQRFAGHFGDARAVEMLAEIGFDALDFSMFRMSDSNYILNTDAYKEYITNVRKAADKAGIVFNQAHAPYTFNWFEQNEYDNIIFPRTVRSIEIASMLGAKIIVVHPVHHFVYKGHEKEIKDVNMAFYRSLLPYCEKYDIKIALENMWQFDEKRKCIVADTCSSSQEFIDYLDTLNDEHFVGCIDVGHTVLAGEDNAEMIRALGPKRLQSLHIHDNDFLVDAHVFPYAGKLDWNSIAQALGEIGYQGDFTFEVDHSMVPYDKELLPSVARFLENIGRHLMAKVEKAAASVK